MVAPPSPFSCFFPDPALAHRHLRRVRMGTAHELFLTHPCTLAVIVLYDIEVTPAQPRMGNEGLERMGQCLPTAEWCWIENGARTISFSTPTIDTRRSKV